MTKNKTAEIQAHTENDTHALAAKLANAISPGLVVYLAGDLGAGKTTFTRGFLRALGHDGKVKSPTYTLVEPYEFDDVTINHFDLYRLNDAKELEAIGISEYFANDTVCLIEWPEKGDPVLPAADLTCYIEKTPSGRIIRIEAHTQHGDQVLAKV
jgi:tRNA threonylcarbamoyladenosine biosynthesis protein TsaE